MSGVKASREKPYGLLAALSLVLLCLAPAAESQYFGRNKVLWDRFDFQILETERFRIHYYPPDAEHAEYVARLVERWYVRLSHWFDHEFEEPRPLIIYRDHADFQQTVITPGLIGEGTGGFAESMSDRMVLPLTGVNAANDHVIGHELVHAFQFDIMRGPEGQGGRRGAQVPLWVMEGLAEYLSEGRHDPATAIVLRDAVLHDALPEQSGIFRRQLSPYHYGQAVWAYIAGRWGDDTARAFFTVAVRQGLERAFDAVLGMRPRDFFDELHGDLRTIYEPLLEGRQHAAEAGERLLHAGTTGSSINLAPSLSPDGRWIAFLSTRELDLDLFLADAETGRIERRLVSAEGDGHFDNLSFLDSSVGWAPDSRRMAFAVFSRGERRIAIYDRERRRTERLLHIDGIKGMRHPAWTPDGRSIVFSAQTNGASDLYLFDLETDALRRLTDDGYDALQPQVSPDGRYVVYVTDRGPATSLELLQFGPPQLALLDLETGAIEHLRIFDHGRHTDPHFSTDGESLYFVAEPDGVPDLFRYRLPDGAVSRLTALKTGVQGITSRSPAMSAAGGAVVYSVLEDSRWSVYSLRNLEGEPVAPADLRPTTAGVLPPLPAEPDPSLVEEYLAAPAVGLMPRATARERFPVTAYRPSFSLAGIGPATIGVGADTAGGMGLEGAVSLFFSDPLNRHQLVTSFQGGGGTQGVLGIEDMLGMEAIYLNQNRRFQWGSRVQHIPFLRTASFITREVVEVDGRMVPAEIVQRLYDVQRVTGASLLGQYPFSMSNRLEGAVGVTHVGFSRELERIVFPAGAPAYRDDISLPTPPSIGLQTASMAFVRDTSRFGFVSPLRGTRLRVEGEVATGDLRFQTGRLDYRRYFFRRPLTFAFRTLHIGRHGADAEDPRLPVLDVGRGDLVRGYELGSFSIGECTLIDMTSCPEFERLIGSRIAVANFELRLPLLGTEEFGLFNVPILPTEAMVFVDAGAAWSSGQSVHWSFERETTRRVPVFSAGIATRSVIFGALPLELYYAFPYQRPRERGVFGFRIGIGW